MSFEHAPVSKGLMVGLALSSILVGVFDIKHYFHLQLVPHISRHYQYWRLGAHHLAFSSSSDLFIAEILLYNISIPIERQFGTLKFASFAIISTLLATVLEFVSLILFHRAGLNYIPSGPYTLIFNIIYQYSRMVPSSYSFRIFGLPLTNKSYTYLFAFQLATAPLPGSLLAALLGILTGQIYRSDLAALKTYRLPPRLAALSARFLLPLVGSLRPARRSNRALPEAEFVDTSRRENDEVITTARPASPSAGTRNRTPAQANTNPNTNPPSASADAQRTLGSALGLGIGGTNGTVNADGGAGATSASVMREWVQGLTGARAQPAGIRIPSEGEVAQLAGMFPDISREVLVGTLQRSPNISSAVETLLSSQR
ncbi:hypothetical protein B0H16DRAFT_1539922 [Mycena metata]|uniref:CUE domain-containing protein n=1 Tax=Mycena metata TaxID=1033252 RepID=A0AAD7NDN2_9AGAR|nr:hypothetical protein B0H16DRAFT_1539922 [Mycena metata]